MKWGKRLRVAVVDLAVHHGNGNERVFRYDDSVDRGERIDALLRGES